MIKVLLPYLISAGLVFCIFKIHMSSNVDSMLNEKNTTISNRFLSSQIRYHNEFAPFARRPLTTFLIEKTSGWLGITLGKAFIWVNFFLFFLSGILLFRLSNVLSPGYLKGILNIIIYFLSFSVLFAFFPPIFSYDEPLQYCLVFAGLTSFQKKQWAAYVLWFTAAMISRENTAFLIFGLAMQAPIHGSSFSKILDPKRLGTYILVGLPIVLYLVFTFFFIEAQGLWVDTQNEFQVRFSCFEENFRDAQSAIETIISLVLTVGIFIYFLLVSFIRRNPSPVEKSFINAFAWSSILNTVIVLVAAFSREARLFALPLLFLWPIMSQCCFREIRLLLTLKIYLQCFSKWKYCTAFALLALMNYIISFIVFVPSFPSADNYFNEYLFLSLQLIFLHSLLRHYVNHNPWAYTPLSVGSKRHFQ